MTAPLIAGFAMAVFLGASGLAKLDGSAYWRNSVEGWFHSDLLKQATQRFLPWLELAIGIVCVVRPLIGLVLAGLFFLGMALGVALLIPTRRGMTCGCFGRMSQGTIRWSLAGRNAILGVAALAVVGATNGVTAAGTSLPGVRLLVWLSCISLTLLLVSARSVLPIRRKEASRV